MTSQRLASIGLFLVFLLLPAHTPQAAGPPVRGEPNRSPIDLVVTPDEKYVVTANHTADSISLVELATGRVLTELPVGRRPAALTLTPDGKTVLVSASWSGEVVLFSLADGVLRRLGAIATGFEPRGLAVSPDNKLGYVALSASGEVAVLDLAKRTVVSRIAVGRWPRFLALSPDGKRLAVGVSGDGGAVVVDTVTRKREFLEDFVGLNLGQMQIDREGKFAWFPYVVYGQNPITTENVERGWVLASRIARVRLDRQARREAISLDPQGRAVGDPHGLALSPDEKRLVCSGSGTHELLVFRVAGLPFMDYGGPGDHLDPNLLVDEGRFHRIEVGGRPMTLRFLKDNRRVVVANYLRNSVQVVDVEARKILREVVLGGPTEPTLARQGEAIFHDARRSFDQWFSCYTCHYEGGTNAQSMDTRNDGRFGNFKTVLPLHDLERTGPWFWHGNEKNLDNAIEGSLRGTMVTRNNPTARDVAAVRAYFKTLELPPNPWRTPDGGLTEAAKRGEKLFAGVRAGCARCHPAPSFTDSRSYDVGTGDRGDVFKGFNPPNLRGLYRRLLFLHDGRSKSLEDLLRGPHNPEKVTGRGKLTDAELSDLIAYLRSL